MSDPARALRDAFRRAIVAQGTLNPTTRPCGQALSQPHAHALLSLLHHGTPMTVKELANTLNIDRSNVSRLTTRMENDGELTRSSDQADARTRRLSLTPKGLTLAQHVDTTSADYFAQILQALGPNADNTIQAFQQFTHAIAHTSAKDKP